MITLINSKEILQISIEDWHISSETYFSPTLNNSLALILDRNPVNFSFGITNPGLIHYNCLNNKFIIDSGKLTDCLLNDHCFNPLLSALSENKIYNLTPDEISLLSYFYLNALPFSVSLITRWFSDTGTEQSKAVKLGNIVFMARTDKEEQDPDFIREIERLNIKNEGESSKDDFTNVPLNLKDAFDLLVKNPDFKLTYDCIGDIHLEAETPVHEIYLGELDETGFLIEDHAFIIAGLSVKVTEFAKLTEYKWPVFTETLFNEIPLHLRDYCSLGRLLLEKPSHFSKLSLDCKVVINIICYSPYAGNKIHNFKDFETLLFSNSFSEIPVMLKIIK